MASSSLCISRKGTVRLGIRSPLFLYLLAGSLTQILNLFEPHFIFCKGGYILNFGIVYAKGGIYMRVPTVPLSCLAVLAVY